MTGAPLGPGCQPTPLNLSVPLWAKVRQSCSWCSPRTLTQKWPAALILGHDDDVLAGQNSTNAGSSDRDVKDWHVRPTGAPPSMAVMIVIPEQKCPRTVRNVEASTAMG